MTTTIHGASATMILDSVAEYSPRFSSVQARYPRMVHADCKTHRIHSGYEGEILSIATDISILIDRDMSRNGRSSRAVPVDRLLKEARENPYVPAFRHNAKGMTPGEEFDPDTLKEIEERWIAMCRYVTEQVEWFNKMDVHKQWANRPLEFFGYIDMVLSTTNWDNFLALRDHSAAQQEMQDLAKCVAAELENSKPQILKPGQWHLPYISEEDRADVWSRWRNPDGNEFQYYVQPDGYWDELKKISTARVARVSIAPFDGNAAYAAEFKRYELLVGSMPVHASPAESIATPDVWVPQDLARDGIGWQGGYYKHPHLHGNLDGWIQHRKQLKDEVVRRPKYARHFYPSVEGAVDR